MNHPAADLQKAIYSALANNSQLVTALGGTKIFDHSPGKADFPYVILGRATATDWSTSTEDGKSHLITVHTWSNQPAKQEVWAIQQLVNVSLHDADLQAQDHHIINLRMEFSEIRYDRESGNLHGIMRFSAVTEPKI